MSMRRQDLTFNIVSIFTSIYLVVNVSTKSE